jgi:ATP-dependent RNA helicase DDX3X
MGKVKKIAAARPDTSAPDFNAFANGVRAEPLVLIIAPTRELCCQIYDEARRLCYRSMLRPCVAYGGAPSREQMIELRKGCDILVATPGRLIDFMRRANLLSLNRVRYTIIDEADELLQDDWEEEMAVIMSGGGKLNFSLICFRSC